MIHIDAEIYGKNVFKRMLLLIATLIVQVEIKKSVPREKMVKGPRTKKIFVGGIPTSITEGKQEAVYDISHVFLCYLFLI